jgi:hypothetical protein
VLAPGDEAAKSKRRWIWAGLLAVLALVGVLSYRPLVRLLRPDLTQAACQSAPAASVAIFSFLDERRALESDRSSHPLTGVPADEQEAAWLEYLAESGRFQHETIAQFSEQFGAEVRWLIEGFTILGTWPRGHELDDRVANELAIRDLAIEIGTAARRLDCPGAGGG